MAVQPALGFYQSTDALTLTLVDESVYTTPPITDYTRKVQLWTGKDGTGTMLDELDFVDSELTVDYALTADKYISAVLIFTGSPAVADTTINFTTQQFEVNALNSLLNANCGCGTTKTCGKSTMGFIYLYQSQVATLAGNSGLANSFIQSSLKWLNS